MKKVKEILKRPQLRYGTYSTAVSVAFILIVIVVNMIANQLPETWKQVDLSENNLYEITDTSKELVTDLEQEIEFIVLADRSSVDERIKIFIEKYAAMSKKISIEWINPIDHPSALEEYDASSNSLVIRCAGNDKQEIVYMADMIEYDYSSYYTTGYATESAFDAEGQITSAIYSVTNNISKKIYCTTGHGEVSFSTTISDLFDKSNFETEEINTLMTGEIPKDCDLLFCYAPATDFTEDEKTMVSEYITNGGDVFLMLGVAEQETPNLDALMEEFGLQRVEGYIADTQRCYQGNYYYIFPELSLTEDLSNGMTSEMVLLVESFGMTEVEPARDTIDVSAFMETSSNGYAVNGEDVTEGTYILGAIATEEEGQFTVIGTDTMIASAITDNYSTLENATLFMNAVTNHFEDVENISIEAKSLEITYNTMQYAGVFGLIVIIGIPLVVLIYGFVKWLKRRKA